MYILFGYMDPKGTLNLPRHNPNLPKKHLKPEPLEASQSPGMLLYSFTLQRPLP